MRNLSDSIEAKLSPEQWHRVWELALYAVNTSEFYKTKFSGLQRSLYRKYIKNDYVEEQANKAFYNIIPTIIKMYNKECDENIRLTEAEKQALAAEIRDHYTMDFHLHPDGGLLAYE